MEEICQYINEMNKKIAKICSKMGKNDRNMSKYFKIC